MTGQAGTEDILEVVMNRIAALGISERQAGLRAGSPGIINDMKRGSMPAFDRACKLLHELGLDIHIGPPRPPPAAQPEKTSSDRVISASPVDISDANRLVTCCPLLAKILAQLCEEWAAMEPRAKKRMYDRFCAYFPELSTGRRVTQVVWEDLDSDGSA